MLHVCGLSVRTIQQADENEYKNILWLIGQVINENKFAVLFFVCFALTEMQLKLCRGHIIISFGKTSHLDQKVWKS